MTCNFWYVVFVLKHGLTMYPWSRTGFEGQADLKLKKDLACLLSAQIIDMSHYTWPVGSESEPYSIALAGLLCC